MKRYRHDEWILTWRKFREAERLYWKKFREMKKVYRTDSEKAQPLLEDLENLVFEEYYILTHERIRKRS